MAVAATTYATSDKAGFLTRTVATIIDGVLVSIVSAILGAILSGGDPTRSNGVSLVVGLAYYLYFWSSYGHGQTLGKRALSIRVVKTDGSELTLVDAFVRYVGWIISFLVVLLGVLWVIWDPDKQGWHDKIAKTYVVKA